MGEEEEILDIEGFIQSVFFPYGLDMFFISILTGQQYGRVSRNHMEQRKRD
jgi:hypothetical protein